MIDETLESAASDLDKARGKINATREALERALEAVDSDEIRAAIARLDRIESELAAVERTTDRHRLVQPMAPARSF